MANPETFSGDSTVTVGNPTKASNYATLADNTDHLWEALNVITVAADADGRLTQLLVEAAAASTKIMIDSNWDPASGTPAANQAIRWRARMSDSANNQDVVGALDWVQTDVTSTSEDLRLDFLVITAGTLAAELSLTGAALYPSTNDGLALGIQSTNEWSDADFASGAVIGFANRDVTLTHASNALTMDGGDLRVADGNGIVIGNSAQVAIANITAELEILGTANADASAVLAAWRADQYGPYFIMGKSRNATIGSLTIVQNGDELGTIIMAADDGGDMVTEGARIAALVDGTPGANDMPTRMVFSTTADGANTVTERMRLTNGGLVIIGDGTTTGNADMTIGLTIDQGANDNQIFAGKSSDVAHGFTSYAETKTYLSFTKAGAAVGGAMMQAVREDDAGATSLLIRAFGGTAQTAKTTGANAAIQIEVGEHDGANAFANMAADSDLMALGAYVSGGGFNTRFIWDLEGSGHADVEWTTYDAYDDFALVRTIEDELLAIEHPAKTERRHMLEQIRIIGEDSWHFENGKPRAMVNFTCLAMLHHGALLQAGEKFAEIEHATTMLRAHHEERLEALEMQIQKLLTEGRN